MDSYIQGGKVSEGEVKSAKGGEVKSAKEVKSGGKVSEGLPDCAST